MSDQQDIKRRLTIAVIIYSLSISTSCSDNLAPGGMPENVAGAESMMGGNGGIMIGGSGPIVEYPDECIIGETLGLCATCGPQRTPLMPNNDENCPFVDCSPLTQYQAMNNENGGRTCLEYSSTPPESSCKDLGQCYEDIEEACQLNPTPSPLVTVYPGCGEFTGCEGSIGPDGSTSPVGSVCHGLGECGADGRCSAPQSCSGVHPEYVTQFCSDDNDSEVCDKHIDLNGVNNASDINCDIACATIGRCVSAWDSNGGCSKGGQVNCDTRRRQLICRCE